MDIEDGDKIRSDAKRSNELTYGRIEKARKNVARILNMLESASMDVKYACELAGWNDEVAFQMEKAATELGYALATLTTWDDAVADET